MSSHSICVFAGARPGSDPLFTETAQSLGTALAREGWTLVYGAGDRGLMGSTASAADAAGGKVLGFIPTHLRDIEAGSTFFGTAVTTNTMHDRKKLMFVNSDAVVALPGGAGTLDELIEVLTWRQLGLHSRPLIVLNAGGYWDPLLALVDHVIATGFAGDDLREALTVTTTVEETMDSLRKTLG